MPQVVFVRGANLGARRFSPARLAKDLARFEVTSIGAAGTFVARKGAERTLRGAVRKALPFEAHVMVVPAQAVLDLVAGEPFAKLPKDAKGFVSVLAGAPSDVALPLARPAGASWEVRIVAITGPFALSERRNRQGRHYPNELVEKELGVRATTRGWDTLLTVHQALTQA